MCEAEKSLAGQTYKPCENARRLKPIHYCLIDPPNVNVYQEITK